MTNNGSIAYPFHCRRGRRQRKELRRGPAPPPPRPRVPRVARILALAHHLDHLVRTGALTDHGAVVRLGRVDRSRLWKIMLLLCLAPDIQEEVLFLPETLRGREPIKERDLETIARCSGSSSL